MKKKTKRIPVSTVQSFNMELVRLKILHSDPLVREYIEALEYNILGWKETHSLAMKKIFELTSKK